MLTCDLAVCEGGMGDGAQGQELGTLMGGTHGMGAGERVEA